MFSLKKYLFLYHVPLFVISLAHGMQPTALVELTCSTIAPEYTEWHFSETHPTTTVTDYAPNLMSKFMKYVDAIQRNIEPEEPILAEECELLFPQMHGDDTLSLIHKIIAAITATSHSWEYHNLSMCKCGSFELAERIFITFLQLNALLDIHPELTTPINHVSLGSGSLLQLFLLGFCLKSFGYQEVHLHAIDRKYHYKWEQYLFEVFKREINSSTITLHPHVSTLAYHSTIAEHPELQAKSFDMIDIGGFLHHIYPLISYPKDLKFHLQLETYSMVDVRAATSPLFYLFLCRHDNNRVIIGKPQDYSSAYAAQNKIDHEVQEEHLTAIENLASEAASYTSMNDIISFLFSKKQTVIEHAGKDFSDFSLGLYAHPFLDFAELTSNHLPEDKCPLIFEGIGSDSINQPCRSAHTIRQHHRRFNPLRDFSIITDRTGQITHLKLYTTQNS